MVMNVEQARFNMVEQQIRPWEVLDQNVLDLLFVVRREEFVPAPYRALAFADLEIPIGEGQKMWAPKMEARVLQELALRPGDSVLEVGTGSGYFAALLSRMAGTVTTVETFAGLHESARARLESQRCANVTAELGDAANGWGEQRYDAIVLTGSTPMLPRSYLQQLKPGGRLFAIVGEAPAMSARLITCAEPGSFRSRDIFETVVEPLVNAPRPPRFTF